MTLYLPFLIFSMYLKIKNIRFQACVRLHYDLWSIFLIKLSIIFLLTNSKALANDTPSIKGAIKNGHVSYLREKLNKGWDPNTILDKRGNTPLIIAVRNRKNKTVKLLLKHQADPNLSNNWGINPLISAVSNSDEKIVQLLLKFGANLNYKPKNKNPHLYIAAPVTMAANLGYQSILKILLNNGAQIDLESENGQTPLYLASCSGNDRIVKLLVKEGADIDHKDNYGWTPLDCSIKNNSLQTVRILLAAGSKVNHLTNRGFTPLHIAARLDLYNQKATSGSKSIFNFEREIQTRNINKKKNRQITRNLFLNGVATNIQDTFGNTALHYFVRSDNSDAIEIVLHNGANPFLKNRKGLTPLELALKLDRNDLFRQLILNNYARSTKNIPVHLQNKFEEIVKKENVRKTRQFLEFGVSPNFENLTGWTPLLLALKNKNQQLVNILLKNGGDPCRINKWNVSAAAIDDHGFIKLSEEWCSIANSSFNQNNNLVSHRPVIKNLPIQKLINTSSTNNFYFSDFILDIFRIH